MTLKPASVESREVLDLVALLVAGAAKDGGVLAAGVEAQRLLDTHPDCQIPFEELRDTIARLAVERSVGVEFGGRSGETGDPK